MARPHMESAGLSLDEIARIVSRSRRIEQFVADVYGGSLRAPGDEIGDVDIPEVGTVDVKSVPSPSATFVDGGRYRPSVLAIVASDVPRLVLGLVTPEQWELGIPDVPTRRKPTRCWHVLRADVFPPPPPFMRIGCVDPDWYARSDDVALHADWNDRNRRRVERRRNAPIPTPWADEESVARGTGLAGRRGHAPGQDNWRRRRP